MTSFFSSLYWPQPLSQINLHCSVLPEPVPIVTETEVSCALYIDFLESRIDFKLNRYLKNQKVFCAVRTKQKHIHSLYKL